MLGEGFTTTDNVQKKRVFFIVFYEVCNGGTAGGRKAKIALGMGDSGNLFCESLCQLFGSARLRRGVAGNDPHPGFW
jgi:hypothetical protein